jgi:hypothetical protein
MAKRKHKTPQKPQQEAAGKKKAQASKPKSAEKGKAAGKKKAAEKTASGVRSKPEKSRKTEPEKKQAKKPAYKDRSKKKKAPAVVVAPVDALPAEESRRMFTLRMSRAPRIGASSPIVQMLPISVFTAVVIMLVHQYRYTRAQMPDFYWTSSSGSLIEFFSHYKVVLIEVCVGVAALVLLYRFITQAFVVRKSILYIPMLVYLGFVLLSFLFSKEKYFAWVGWNDRFEGTAIILCYFIMLFYAMNTVSSERDLKWILYPLAGMTVLLSLLGLSQATGHDFFQTVFGQKLITPHYDTLSDGSQYNVWQAIDDAAANGEQYLKFTFQNNEIYQTVYNINYVSFYLTLLLPLFGLVFIHEKDVWKKTLWGVVFALLVFNLIGSASSGGLMGCFVIVLVAVILFRKKIWDWRRSVAILVGITVLTAAGSLYIADATGGIKWSDELKGAIASVLGRAASSDEDAAEDTAAVEAAEQTKKLDYFVTKGGELTIGYDGSELTIGLTKDGAVTGVKDKSGTELTAALDGSGSVVINDARFTGLSIQPSQTEDGLFLFVVMVDGEDQQWPFAFDENDDDAIKFYNLSTQKMVDLTEIPHIGFANNQGFGSGRGYIWSATFPMLASTIFVGKGADTYCIYFPHNDYVGKYKASWNIYMIVDKPHNLYLGMATGTGVISVVAFLTMMGLYLVQSYRLYRRQAFEGLTAVMGAGIFLGICGFLVSAVVNDSTVSIMPLFYGLLGTGIACNFLIGKNEKLPRREKKEKTPALSEPAEDIVEAPEEEVFEEEPAEEPAVLEEFEEAEEPEEFEEAEAPAEDEETA